MISISLSWKPWNWQTEKLSHSDLDERALDALKEFPVEGALAVLKQFLESNLVNTWLILSVSEIMPCCRSTCPTSPPTCAAWWRPTGRRPGPGPAAPTEAASSTRGRTRRRSRWGHRGRPCFPVNCYVCRRSLTGRATVWTWPRVRGSMGALPRAATGPHQAMAVRSVQNVSQFESQRVYCYFHQVLL